MYRVRCLAVVLGISLAGPGVAQGQTPVFELVPIRASGRDVALMAEASANEI